MTPRSFSSVMSKDELRALSTRSDLRGFIVLAANWGLILAAFAIAIVAPNPITFVFAVLIVAGRQLGLGIIVHDCAHGTLFRKAALNNFVGQWLAGAVINTSLTEYRAYHLRHHQYAGSARDPDLIFVQSYPVSPSSLRRKFWRDLTGRTGFRDLKLELKRFHWRKNGPWIAFQVLAFTATTIAGAPWAFAIWWVARIYIYPAIVRLRQIGEHGVAINRGATDPRLNTSTTIASWWEKLLIAPNNVHFHLEHHLAANIPPYRLQELHRLLEARGFFVDYDCLSQGYADVLRRAVRTAAQSD